MYYVSIGGFDTHAQQATRHTQLLTQVGDAMSAFIKDMDKLGHGERVTLMTLSEFGRRVSKNNSQGTDHGKAAPMFLAGAAIKGGVYGDLPELRPVKLSRGDVPWKIDFRQVYATVLANWTRTDAVAVLGQKFAPLPVWKA